MDILVKPVLSLTLRPSCEDNTLPCGMAQLTEHGTSFTSFRFYSVSARQIWANFVAQDY